MHQLQTNTKAFDKVNYSDLFHVLLRDNCDGKDLRVIEAPIRIDNDCCVYKPSCSRVGQGCVFSPNLFNTISSLSLKCKSGSFRSSPDCHDTKGENKFGQTHAVPKTLSAYMRANVPPPDETDFPEPGENGLLHREPIQPLPEAIRINNKDVKKNFVFGTLRVNVFPVPYCTF